jgi:hypothetical protein
MVVGVHVWVKGGRREISRGKGERSRSQDQPRVKANQRSRAWRELICKTARGQGQPEVKANQRPREWRVDLLNQTPSCQGQPEATGMES